MALISRGTGSSLFKGLSSFWTRVFRDSAVIDSLYSGVEVLLGDLYLDLMEAVLAKSLRNIPVFSRRDWQLLILNNTDLSFDPAIYSFATTNSLGVAVTVTALELSAGQNDHSMELSDAYNLSAEKKILYPTHGIFNLGIVHNSPLQEKAWVIVVPTAKTIFESIRTLSRRVVSNKRIETTAISSYPNLEQIPPIIRNSLQGQGTWNAATNVPPIPPAELTTLDTSGNTGDYYQVEVAGTTTIDGVSNWQVGDWIVSLGDRWVKAPAEPPVIQLRYGNEVTGNITIPVSAYADIWSLRAAIEAALASDPVLAGPIADSRLVVDIDGGYLTLTSDRDLVIWAANTSAEQQLFLKEFRFKFTAAIPPGRENQIFWNQTHPIQLQTTGYKPAGTEYRFPVDKKIKDAKYIYNTLYDPSVVLESPRHFRIANGFIYLKDNPFALENLAFRDFGNGVRQLALWMSDVSVDTLDLYYNYGYRYTRLHESSQAYKDFLRGIWYYFTHGPQVERLVSALNIVAGIPVVAENDELVIHVAPNGQTVVTDKNTYEFLPNTPATVQVGDLLQAFDSMTETFAVEDYISNPDWFDHIVIPEFLMPDAPLGFRLSSVSSTIPLVGDPGFIVGDTIPDAPSLVTNTVIPQSPGDYSLNTPAYFEVEKDRNGVTYKIYVPTEITLGTTSLAGMVSYLLRASRQVFSNPVNCAGANIFRLLTTATFTMVYKGVARVISVTPTDTATISSLSSLASVLQTKVDTAFGSDQITVFPYLDQGTLVFIPSGTDVIKFIDLNVSARSELGLYPTSSLTGISIAENNGTIKFSSTTVGNSARVKISNMTQTALDSLGMKTFRPGSGDFFGTSGDPSPGWEIMNTYLKYNTFRVKFDPAAVVLEESLMTIPEIISAGRPLYTTAIILPEFRLFDTVTSTDIVVDDLAELDSLVTADDVFIVGRKGKQKGSVFLSNPAGIFYRKDGVLGDPERYLFFYSPGSTLTLTSVSTDGGSLTFTSKEPGFKYVDHKIEVTDLSHIKSTDLATFTSVGVYNRGKATGGASLSTRPLGVGTVGGIYPAALKGELGAHWGNGLDKADINPYATHVLVIDSVMKASNDINPFEAGVTAGDFIELKNFADPRNNGTFVVMNFFHNVSFLGRKDGFGSPIMVDVVVYRNIFHDVSTDENFSTSTVPVAASVAFRPKGSLLSSQWLVILPNTGTLQQQVTALLSTTTDDGSIFPWDITAVDGTYDPPSVNTYHEGVTHNGNPDEEITYGEPYKISRDIDPTHEDAEAVGIWTPDEYSPEAFVIGDPSIFIHEFDQSQPGFLAPDVLAALNFKGMWNAVTGLPTIPAATPSNKGWYYFVNVPGNTVIDGTYGWQIGDWLVSDGSTWRHIYDDPEVRIVGYPTPYYAWEDTQIFATVGGSFGTETYAYDSTAVGRVDTDTASFSSPYLLGQDTHGKNLYTNYSYATKLNSNTFIKFGEITFWRSLWVYFSTNTPTDMAAYIGHDTTIVSPVSEGPRVWPSGGATVYPSDSFQGFFDATNNRAGSKKIVPKSFVENLDLTTLNELSFVSLWDASTNTPSIPAASLANQGQYYKVAVAGTTTIDGYSAWAAGDYLVSNGTSWVYCSPISVGGAGLFFPLPDGLSSSLPAASSSNIGDTYLVSTSSNVAIPGIIASVDAGHDLFEVNDWIVSNGLSWVRHRADYSTMAENIAIDARRSLDSEMWLLEEAVSTETPGATDALTFGAGVEDTYAGVLPSSDSAAGVIGAGALPDVDPIPSGYVIGGTSLWTGIIGPFPDGGAYVGDFLSDASYFMDVAATKFEGYSPDFLDTSTYVSSVQTNIENSSIFGWASDNSVIPTGALARAYLPSISYFTLYIQVPESSLESPEGVTVLLDPGVSLYASPEAVKLCYYDGTWATPSLATLDASLVTTSEFTLRVVPSDGSNHCLQLWTTNSLDDVPNGQSSNISPSLYASRTPGEVLVAITFAYSGTFGVTSNWLRGVLTTKVSVT